MDDRSLQPNRDPQLDEAIWNAWVKRNESKDKIRLARRKQLLCIILVVGVVVLLIWRFTRPGAAFR